MSQTEGASLSVKRQPTQGGHEEQQAFSSFTTGQNATSTTQSLISTIVTPSLTNEPNLQAVLAAGARYERSVIRLRDGRLDAALNDIQEALRMSPDIVLVCVLNKTRPKVRYDID